MLQLNTVHEDTYSLLKEISAIKELDYFALAGGTSLSLQLGHRISVDLDFFTLKEFNTDDIITILQNNYKLSEISKNKNSLTLYVNYKTQKVKIDFLRHNYPVLNNFFITDGIKFFSVEDIAAMKLNAITNRGAKKDFYDIYELLLNYPLTKLIDLYKKKYVDMNVFTLIKSLSYFDDANNEPEPISLQNVNWDIIKSTISTQVEEYDK